MSGQWNEVARLHFRGERFRDHALDLSALSELRQFQKMVAETAKALWRAANPDRKYLPAHFEDRTRLCLREIKEGSATAPLEVYIEEPEQGELWERQPVEVNDAIDLAYQVFGAVHDDAPLPERFPKELLPEYAKWGQGLGDDEVLEFSPPGKSRARITPEDRKRLEGLSATPYDDAVDVTGEVLEADVRQKRFQLWTNEKTSVQVSFTDEQEGEVTTALKEHRAVRVHVKGRGGFSPQGVLQRIGTVDQLTLIPCGQIPFDPDAPSIEAELIELARAIPDEEWDNLPADLMDDLDHYLYGTPEA